jgi:hypothetical protein
LPSGNAAPQRDDRSSDDKTVRDGFLSTVVNQIAENDPPEAKATYARLQAQGLTEARRSS